MKWGGRLEEGDRVDWIERIDRGGTMNSVRVDLSMIITIMMLIMAMMGRWKRVEG